MIKNKIKNFFTKNEYLALYFEKNVCWQIFCWGFFGLPPIGILIKILYFNNDATSKWFYYFLIYLIVISFCFAFIILITIITTGTKWKIYRKKLGADSFKWYSQGKEKQIFILYLKIQSWIIFIMQFLFSISYLVVPFLNFYNDIFYSSFSLVLGFFGLTLNLLFFYYFYVKVDFKKLK